MRSQFLFPSKLRYLGYLFALPGFVLGYLVIYQHYNIPGFELQIHEKSDSFLSTFENFTNELALTLVIVGLILIAFSKLKHGDELTSKIRLNALYWAILINYCFYLLVCLYSNVSDYYHHNVLSGNIDSILAFATYNFFTPLVIFILRFYYLLYRNKNVYTTKQVRYLPNKPYLFLGKWLSVCSIIILIIGTLFTINEKLSVLLSMLLPLSLLLWAYSKERSEDEYISSIRLEAMQIAVYVNYGILLVSNMLVYGMAFWLVQLLNLLTIPLIFIIWFQFRLYRLNKAPNIKAMLI